MSLNDQIKYGDKELDEAEQSILLVQHRSFRGKDQRRRHRLGYSIGMFFFFLTMRGIARVCSVEHCSPDKKTCSPLLSCGALSFMESCTERGQAICIVSQCTLVFLIKCRERAVKDVLPGDMHHEEFCLLADLFCSSVKRVNDRELSFQVITTLQLGGCSVWDLPMMVCDLVRCYLVFPNLVIVNFQLWLYIGA